MVRSLGGRWHWLNIILILSDVALLPKKKKKTCFHPWCSCLTLIAGSLGCGPNVKVFSFIMKECVHTCRSSQKISDQRNKTITVTGQSTQQAMVNTVGGKSSIIDVNPLEDTNINNCYSISPAFIQKHPCMNDQSLLCSMKPHRRH